MDNVCGAPFSLLFKLDEILDDRLPPGIPPALALRNIRQRVMAARCTTRPLVEII